MNRFQKTIDDIDAANSRDARFVDVQGASVPFELDQSRRLSAWVETLCPDASEDLRLAARGQHVARWTIPRETYPSDRGGYLRWREDLKTFHAKTVTDFMRENGYGEQALARVTELISKRALKAGDEEGQILEDALCLVFLQTQLDEFLKKNPPEKAKSVLAKTWKKMGPLGRQKAMGLNLPASHWQFIEEALGV